MKMEMENRTKGNRSKDKKITSLNNADLTSPVFIILKSWINLQDVIDDNFLHSSLNKDDDKKLFQKHKFQWSKLYNYVL